MKFMISQPMRGLTEEQIRQNREQVVAKITEAGDEVVDTIHPNYPTHLAEKTKMIPVYYLAKSIEFLSSVDAIFFMKGWEEARGCKIEHDIAIAYDIPVHYEI